MILFYKIVKNLAPKYLQKKSWSAKKNLMRALSWRTLSFNTTLFLCFNKGNRLNDTLRNTNFIYKFKNYLIKFIKVKENPTFSISDLGLKLLTCFRLNFSHLNEHKFRHNFRDTTSPMCSHVAGVETSDHYCVAKIFYLLVRISSIQFSKSMLNSGIWIT